MRRHLFILFFIIALGPLRAQGHVQVSNPTEDPARSVPADQGALLLINSKSRDLAVSSPDLRQKAVRAKGSDGSYVYKLALNWNDEYDDMTCSVSVLSPKGSTSFRLDLQRGKVYVASCTVGNTFLMLDEDYSRRPPGLLPVSGRCAVVINSSAEQMSVVCDDVPLFVNGQAQSLPEGCPIVRLGRTLNEQIWSDTVYFDLSTGLSLQPRFQVSLGESTLSFQLPSTMGVKRVYRYMVIALDQSDPHSAFLHIESTPSGADVIYQGGVVGKTPHDLFVQGKTATVTLQLANYHEANFNVPLRKDKERIPIRAEMKPMFGTLTCLSSPAGAVAWLDSVRLGPTPISRTVLSGTYTLRMVCDLYDTWTQSVTVQDAQSHEVSAELVPANAEVSIQSLPRAAIYIDRNFVGRSSVTRTLSEGTHVLRASLNGYEPVEMTVNVVRNHPMAVDLKPSRDGYNSTATAQELQPIETAKSVQPAETAKPSQTVPSQVQKLKQQQPQQQENPYETFNQLNAQAERGDAKAQCLTGICYFKGEGIMRSLPSAYYYFALSAKQGYADGQYWLAYCLQHGYGTAVDLEKARDYYQKAAAQGHTQAAEALRNM